MKNNFIVSFLLITVFTVQAQLSNPPLHRYLNNFSFSDTSFYQLSGRARIVLIDGRQGINTTSIHSVIKLKKHNLNDPKGSVSLWVCSLEDLSDMPLGANPHGETRSGRARFY